MAVVENLEDMWLLSKLQRDRQAKEEEEKKKKLEVGFKKLFSLPEAQRAPKTGFRNSLLNTQNLFIVP